MRTLILATLLLVGCVHPVTATGVKECWTTFYLIGWYKGCAEGPSWQQHIDDPKAVRAATREIEPPPPAPTEPAPAFFCFASPKDELIAGCARTRMECMYAREHATDDPSSLPDCESVAKAYCFGETCMPTATGCVERRNQVARADTPTCDEHR